MSLDESVSLIPGVFAASRQNPSQDPRISIRGFGARSAFGVRGVRVLWEGIPLTVADGQTPIDYVDMEAVDRVEVMRGSASALYGNSSGGVIALSSMREPSHAAVKQWQESGATRRSAARFVGASDLVSSVSVNRTAGQGFRDFSNILATRASALVGGKAGLTSWKLHLSGMDMPIADNPGSVTAAQMASNPRTADPLSVRKHAGKSVRQVQAGATLSRAFGSQQLNAVVYGGARRLLNPLTFATVELNRTTDGVSVRSTGRSHFGNIFPLLTLGLDIQTQNDDRHEFENCIDTPMPPVTARCPVFGKSTGAVRRNQRELVKSLGAYMKSEFDLGTPLTVSLGARADRIHFEVRDRLPVAALLDQSGTRQMNAASPMIGFVYRMSPLLSLYANGSTAFETPTATELANKPDGTTGLNPLLRPQLARTAELGVKGILRSGVRYDVAGYSTSVRDELIPFEIAGGAGRRFYRNAGRTARSGFEAALEGDLAAIEWNVAYTASRFRFAQYAVASVNYNGKQIPGIPKSKLDAAATVRRFRSFLTLETSFASSAFVDDLNSTSAPSYQLLNMRSGTSIPLGQFSVKPVIGVTNLLNKRYSASLNINAAGGKYYEPASKRLLYGMVQIENRF